MSYNDYSYAYIHNVFGHFVKDTMDYFAGYLYPRFTWRVIGTYDKAVEYMDKQNQYNRDIDMPFKPGLILNPTGDMTTDEPYGNMAARYPQFGLGLVKYMFDPIYRDEEVLVNVGFTRLKGEFEFIALLPSFYEYFDFKIFLLNTCRGTNRKIQPIFFNTFITIPSDLYNYTYTNEYTGESHTLNWDQYGVRDELLETTNTTEKIYPVKILPMFTLTGISDASSRFGGMQNLAEWKLSFIFEYEIDIPSFIILQSDYIAKDLNLDIRVGSAYSINNEPNNDDNEPNIDEMVPLQRYTFRSNMNFSYDSTSQEMITYPEDATLLDKENLEFNARYFYIITQQDIDAQEDLEINLQEIILNYKYMIVFSKLGQLLSGNDYELINNGSSLLLKTSLLNELSFGDIIEMYTYKIK